MPPKTLRAVVLIEADEASVQRAAATLPDSVRSYIAVTGAGVLLTLEQGYPRGVREGVRNRLAGVPARRGSTIRHLVALAESVRTAARSGVVVAAAIVRDGRVLAAARTTPTELAGRWEFPGGKAEPGESAAQALARECAEELGLQVVVGAQLGAPVTLPSGNELLLFACVAQTPAEPRPDPAVHSAVRWLGPAELADVRWLETNEGWLAAVADHLRSTAHLG